MFVAKHGGRFDANQENLALAASNLFAGLGGGFPVSVVRRSRSSTKRAVRAHRSRPPSLRSSFLWLCSFSRIFLNALPQPVLRPLVLVAIAVLKLSTLKELCAVIDRIVVADGSFVACSRSASSTA